MTVRIDTDETTGLDDIAISDVTMFRMEWMDTNQVWVCVYTADCPDGHRFWLNARGKIFGTYETGT